MKRRCRWWFCACVATLMDPGRNGEVVCGRWYTIGLPSEGVHRLQEHIFSSVSRQAQCTYHSSITGQLSHPYQLYHACSNDALVWACYPRTPGPTRVAAAKRPASAPSAIGTNGMPLQGCSATCTTTYMLHVYMYMLQHVTCACNMYMHVTTCYMCM